jgi:hypothetical protein
MHQESRTDGRHAGRSFDDVSQTRRFQRKLEEVRRAGDRYRARPAIEFDESGYPLDKSSPGLVGRVRRLITG